MAKTPQEWRREWLVNKDEQGYLARRFPWKRESIKAARLRVANCVLGYAMARGWVL